MIKPSYAARWRNLPVGKKLAAIPALFAVVIGGILLYTLTTAQDQLSDTVVVDVAGRQRMLNQRYLAQLTMVTEHMAEDADGRSRSGASVADAVWSLDYGATSKLMHDAAAALLDGGTTVSMLTGEPVAVPPAPTAEIRSALVEEARTIEDYTAKGLELLEIDPTDPRFRGCLDEVLELSYRVDVESNECVKLLNEHSQGKISAMIESEAAIGALAVLLGGVFSWIVSRGMVGRLGSVVGAAQLIADGDLRSQKLQADATDEVGQLAAAFDQMLDTLKDMTGQTVAVSNNLNAASAEILASTQQQAAGTRQQAGTVQEITTTMEEVRQSGEQISEKAQRVTVASEATSASSASGLNAVRETNCTMEAIRRQVEEVAENIATLSEKTQVVGEIIATVNDIAERSNLLALNAAIEAAVAGEQGNRFSVVANEIKSLADQAKESTVQVRTILGEIQKGISGSVMLTEEAVKRVEAGKRQADVAEQTIRQMTETTVESVQAFQQIIAATSQQQIGFEQVTRGMQDIRQTASQTAASTLQLEKAVASLNAQSQQLRATVGRFQI